LFHHIFQIKHRARAAGAIALEPHSHHRSLQCDELEVATVFLQDAPRCGENLLDAPAVGAGPPALRSDSSCFFSACCSHEIRSAATGSPS
jgi:hypothetical protein